MQVNSDMGEGFGRWTLGPDAALMPLIDAANIACGFHAGDPLTMLNTVTLAHKHNVAIGAHPGLPDLLGFGRRAMVVEPQEMAAYVLYQVGALQGMIRRVGGRLNHIKPHGALYFYMLRDEEICRAVVGAIKTFGVPLYGLPGTKHESVANELGVPFVPEMFIDIDYDDEGNLVPPAQSQPVQIDKLEEKIRRAREDGIVVTRSGKEVALKMDGRSFTLCVHSDLPGAVEVASAARQVVQRLNGGKQYSL